MVNRAEELITQLEAEIAKRDARIGELERDLSLSHMACELAEEDIAALKSNQPSTQEWPKQECPVTGAVTDVDPSDMGVQQPSAGVVQWPDPDNIMQMADASGYYFELGEFDLFIQRLMDEVARLNPCRAQAVACVACEGHPMGVNNPCAVCGGAQAVPDGYVLVPVDPTPEMLDRYPFNVSAATSEPMDKEDLRVVYQAMIAAAPSAKKESSDA